MKKIKLKLIKVSNLAEIFQTVNLKFAFVNAAYEQVSSPCICRDFLGDCIWSYKTKEAVGLYGFKYSFADSPYDLEKLRLSLTFPTDESKINFLGNLAYLEDKQDLVGLKYKLVFSTQLKDTLVIELDKEWQADPWKLSLLTFYLKIMCYKDIKDLQNPENEYIVHLTPEIEQKMLDKVKEPSISDYSKIGLSENHNRRGFVSVIKGAAPVEHKYIFGGK